MCVPLGPSHLSLRFMQKWYRWTVHSALDEQKALQQSRCRRPHRGPIVSVSSIHLVVDGICSNNEDDEEDDKDRRQQSRRANRKDKRATGKCDRSMFLELRRNNMVSWDRFEARMSREIHEL